MAHYQVFACEVLFREVCFEAAQSPQTLDLRFNRFGLHDVGAEQMVQELQALVDAVPGAPSDAILLAYGLCNNGLVGLQARELPLVLPRAHDCITLLLGSAARYQAEFRREPGTYYKSPGWIEHHRPEGDGHVMKKLGFHMAYQEMVAKYGEENAKYLVEALGGLGSYKQHYTRMAYVDTGLGPREALLEQTRAEAAGNGWRFDLLAGDRRLLRNLVCGEWDEADFLVVPPGRTVRASYDDRIVTLS